MKPKPFSMMPRFYKGMLFGAVLGLAGWYALMPQYMRSEFSPREKYRLDVYHASLFQRLVNYGLKDPCILRLYRAEPDELLGESAVVDLYLNGEVSWYMDTSEAVLVGVDVIFHNVPPE